MWKPDVRYVVYAVEYVLTIVFIVCCLTLNHNDVVFVDI